MKIEQRVWSRPTGWTTPASATRVRDAGLVLLFGAVEPIRDRTLQATVRTEFPHAQILGCSTAGEIHDSEVSDDTLVLTAVEFENTPLRVAQVELREMAESVTVGEQLARQLPPTVPGPQGSLLRMKHVFVLSDGLHVNGSDLVRGLVQYLPMDVTVTGGLAGDGARFGETFVICDGRAASRTVAALAFYGERIRIGMGSLGGWDSFGPERIITRAKGNVLYELDGRSALGLYEQYLGDHARELPAAGLLFPLSLRTKAGDQPVVRTILAIDREKQSMTFAGDVPEGAYARLMKANFDRLIDGAVGAAQAALGPKPELAILISCVGRKLVLKQRIEEEVEGAREVLGTGAVFAGFYSYGEISPFTPGAKCELHNQTMTITTMAET